MTALFPAGNATASRAMLRGFPVVAALAALLVGLGGCQSAQPLVPKSSQTVALSAAHRTPVVTVPIITEVKFVLPGPTQGSGFNWIVNGNNVKVLAQTKEVTYTPDSNRPDGGSSSATFFGLKPGRSVLRFVLIKSAEQIAEPVDHFTVVVEVKDNDSP